ncbi:MAG TPA: anti-sigma factor [Gemmatimonadaceae bacterium]|nr:anti-sigma factor [Gemmatimonadaceae bacterium]
MSHDEASESLAAAALDALSADEQAAVLAHAATCPQCGPELEALRQAMAELGNSAPPARAPASADVEQRLKRIRMRLLARAQADRAPIDISVAPKSAATRRSSMGTWLALAAAIVIVVLLLNQGRSTKADLAQANQAAAAATAALDTARAKIAQDQREIKDLTGPSTEVVGLNTTGAAEATALMFWDKTNNDWAFYAHHVAPLPAGKSYQIWLITPTQKISAGTFTPAADSSVEVHATYALPPNALKGVAVSEEPTGGAPQPTGRIVIVGTPGPK